MGSFVSPLPDSTRLVGSWRLLEQVGSGGSSVVWRATNGAGEIAAVKLLDGAASGTEAERRRFLRGFRLASVLDHPGIARLVEAGEHDGRLYVVEQFVDGETLADRLRSGRLTIAESVRVLRKAGEALAYAHQSGVIHRDLSPRNLMLDQAGRVLLVDFGIAVRAEATTQAASQTLLGTINYIAPELIRGMAASARSDLYALGAIAYQMLTGSPPFVATQPEALLRLHLEKPPARLRRLRPEVDPRLDRVVLRLLAKLPADRFDNAEAFLRALDEALEPRRRSRTPATGERGPRRPAARDGSAIQRLAIAPFTADLDDGSDPDRMARIALGLAETVSAGLAGIEGLKVIPPAQAGGRHEPTVGARIEALGVDALLGAHLVQRQNTRRLSWSLVGPDGTIVEGGRLGGEGEPLFAIEDALLAELIRVLKRPQASGRLRDSAARESWYAPFLEALGCLQRTDSESSVDRAIALLEQIRDAGAGGVQVHAALGRAYLRRAEVRHDASWRQRAEASCRIALSLDPMAPEAMVTMGRLMVLSGKADDAIQLLGRALELDRGNADARVWLSRAHELRGDFPRADEAVRLACEDRPEYWLVHDRRAVLDFRQGRFADAAAGWQQVLRLTPDNAHAYANLGAALLEQGQLAEAEQAFRASIEIAPRAAALDGLGLVHYYQGYAVEAVHWLRRAVEKAPRHPRLWGNLADAQRRVPAERAHALDSFDHAIRLVKDELVQNSASARAWSQLAVYQAKRELHAEARAALDRALELGTLSPQTLTCAVVVHELAGRRKEALAVLRTLAGAAPLPLELRADPELEELRATPAGRRIFASSRPRTGPSDPKPRRDSPCPPPSFRSASS